MRLDLGTRGIRLLVSQLDMWHFFVGSPIWLVMVISQWTWATSFSVVCDDLSCFNPGYIAFFFLLTGLVIDFANLGNLLKFLWDWSESDIYILICFQTSIFQFFLSIFSANIFGILLIYVLNPTLVIQYFLCIKAWFNVTEPKTLLMRRRICHNIFRFFRCERVSSLWLQFGTENQEI